jgi:hypothetical protein
MIRRPTVRRGSAGRSHCGRSTTLVPDGLLVSKLVCTEPPGHSGRHFNRFSGYEWWYGDAQPSKRPGSG